MSPKGAGVRAAVLVATMFGTGRAPVVPGTFGTLVALPPALLLARLLPSWGFAVAAAALAALAVWSSDVAAPVLGSKDPRPVVIDEAAGMFVTLLGLPADVFTIVAGFVLFRLMDIVKPFPARRAEALPGGWGIVTDDLIAGVYANAALRLLAVLATRWGGT